MFFLKDLIFSLNFIFYYYLITHLDDQKSYQYINLHLGFLLLLQKIHVQLAYIYLSFDYFSTKSMIDLISLSFNNNPFQNLPMTILKHNTLY